MQHVREDVRKQLRANKMAGAGKDGAFDIIRQMAFEVADTAQSSHHWDDALAGSSEEAAGDCHIGLATLNVRMSRENLANMCILCESKKRSFGFLHQNMIVHFKFCAECAHQHHGLRRPCPVCQETSYSLVEIEL